MDVPMADTMAYQLIEAVTVAPGRRSAGSGTQIQASRRSTKVADETGSSHCVKRLLVNRCPLGLVSIVLPAVRPYSHLDRPGYR
jgi:hypothetical protein